MNKVIHPVVISEGKSPIIGKEVIKSLHHISSRVTCERREVFLSDEGYGYVWLFSNQDVFNHSSLCRIQNGDWFDLSSIAHRSDISNIATDLREAYNNNLVKFDNLEISNPFYDPCIIGDLIFTKEQKKKIDIYLAIDGGKQMAKGLEGVLDKYKVLELIPK